MTDETESPAQALTRTAASEGGAEFGWRYLLGNLCRSLPASSLYHATDLASRVVAACGADVDAHLRIDLRPDRVEIALQTQPISAVTQRDVELAKRISAALGEVGLPSVGPAVSEAQRPVQMLEIAIDTLDMAAIRPFWKAVLRYADEPGGDGPPNGIVDPVRQGPAFWFQEMDAPRPQRNRIHFDIAVAHDEAQARISAALAAGGVLVSDAEARSFWILADTEGNEICVCTWQDRDPVTPGSSAGDT